MERAAAALSAPIEFSESTTPTKQTSPAPQKPVFCETKTTKDLRLLRDTALVQDVMSIAKFFASLRAAARQRQQQRPSHHHPEHCNCVFSPRSPHGSEGSLRTRMWPWQQSRVLPSLNCARMPTISEEFDAVEAAGPCECEDAQRKQPTPVFTGPVIKRRGGMTALTALTEEEEEGEEDEEDSASDNSSMWEGKEPESPTTSFSSDESCEGKWTDDFVPPSPLTRKIHPSAVCSPLLRFGGGAPRSGSDWATRAQARLSMSRAPLA